MPRRQPLTRGEIMSRVGKKDTKPELLLRKLVHGLGYRYRTHVRGLPGTPDVVFSKRRKVIFVHGCFWHRHPGCRYASTPRTRADYWEAKFARNTARDSNAVDALTAAGWEVLVVWECQLRDGTDLPGIVRKFLGPPRQ